MPVPPGTPLPAPGTSSLGAGAKEEKAVKETRKMFKEIGRVASKVKGMPGAIGAIGAGIESAMPFLEALAPIFKAFEPIMTITNAMFSAFAGAITVELLPALQPLFVGLIAMIPIFSDLGTIVGQIILIVLVPLVDVFLLLLPPITAFLTMLTGSDAMIAGVTIAIIAFGVAIGVLIGPIGIGITAVIAFAFAVAYMIDAITLGMAGAVNYVNSLMGTLPGATEAPPTSLPSGGSTFGREDLLMLQEGTDRVSRSGAFHLDVGEAVTPASEVGLQTSLLEEIRDLQKEQLLDAKWRMR